MIIANKVARRESVWFNTEKIDNNPAALQKKDKH